LPSLWEYDWAKVTLRHANLHKNVGQIPRYTATPKTFYFVKLESHKVTNW